MYKFSRKNTEDMQPTNRQPTTPGELLQEHLEEKGISQRQLAEHIQSNQPMISSIINNKVRISALMAIKLGIAFNTSPEFWMNAQMAADLWEARKTKLKIKGQIQAG